MKIPLKTTRVVFVVLVAFLLSCVSPPKMYASGGPCTSFPYNTGISYDATTYRTENVYGVGTSPTAIGMFSFAGSGGPEIGAMSCPNLVGSGSGLIVTPGHASWYNVRMTSNGIISDLNTNDYRVVNNGDRAELSLELYVLDSHQHYTFQVQACWRYYLPSLFAYCGTWSPHLELTTAVNPFCKPGYVWREAAPFDHVCVLPDQHDQVAYDNAQAPTRINPSGTPTCLDDYVPRGAFGGDDICVDTTERLIVTWNNITQDSHII